MSSSGCGSASPRGPLITRPIEGPSLFGESLVVEIAFLQRGWRVTAHQPSEDGAAGMPARHRQMAMGTQHEFRKNSPAPAMNLKGSVTPNGPAPEPPSALANRPPATFVQ